MPTLSMTAFKGAVAKGPLAPVYVFHGADDHLKDLWVRRVIEAATDAGTRDFNLEVLRGGECDAGRLAGALDALPMLAERRVVVLRDPGALKKAVQPRLLAYLKQPAAETVLLLVVPAGDTPAAPWTAVASVVEFRALEGDDLVKWIVHQTTTACGGTILPEAAALLASYGGSDLSLLDGELRKLVAYTAGAPIDVAAVEAVTGVRPGHTVGDFLDAVARRDTATALTLVEDALAQPKSSGVTLVMALATQTLAIGWGLAARARGLPAQRLESEYFTLLKGSGGAYTGQSWGDAVKCWARHLSRWTAADVDRALGQLREADRAMKDTKVSSEAQLLRSLVLGLAAVPKATTRKVARAVGVLAVAFAFALAPSQVLAQSASVATPGSPMDSALARARRLVNEGAGAVGRSVVDSVLAAVTPGSPDEARVLLWRAMLAESWEAAEQDYLRLMLEFDGSALAGEAMLRLAQGELARGDRAAALRYLERIVRETPTAPVRAEAAVWHGRLLLEQGEATTACPLLREGRTRVPRDADELLTRYDVLLISCANLEATATDTLAQVSTPAVTPAAIPPTPARDVAWTVQLGAYATRAQAEAVRRRIGTNPADVRIDEVPGGPYAFKIRFGRFATRAEAEAAGAAHTRRTGAATFVTEAPR